MARAILLFVKNISKDYLYNVGSGQEISIKDLSQMVSEIINYKGETIWDNSKPDGTPRKLLDSKRIENFGFKSKINLEQGIEEVYKNYIL